MRRIFSIVALMISVAALNGCGQPVCFAGIGVNGQDDCSSGATGGATNQSGSGTFTVTANPTSVVVTRQTQISASGGQNGPYTYTIDPSSNGSIPSNQTGTIDPNSGLYTAPSSIAPSTSIQIVIRATDKTGAFNTVQITITSG